MSCVDICQIPLNGKDFNICINKVIFKQSGKYHRAQRSNMMWHLWAFKDESVSGNTIKLIFTGTSQYSGWSKWQESWINQFPDSFLLERESPSGEELVCSSMPLLPWPHPCWGHGQLSLYTGDPQLLEQFLGVKSVCCKYWVECKGGLNPPFLP